MIKVIDPIRTVAVIIRRAVGLGAGLLLPTDHPCEFDMTTDSPSRDERRQTPRTGATCALCHTRESTPGGEHVLPQWFLRAAFPEPGVYTTEQNGVPIPKNDGTPRTQTSVDRPKIACCPACNKALNDRFERQRMVKLGRRLLAHDGRITMSADEADDLGIWLLKTLLLLSHPEAVSSVPGVKLSSWNLTMVAADLYRWMIANEPPPHGLSVWLMLRATDEGGIDEPPVMTLPVIVVDGRETAFQVKMFGIKRIEFTLVYHPHWPIEHPLEHDGAAIRMWPRTDGNSIDLGPLTSVVPWPVRWVSAGRISFPPGFTEPSNCLHSDQVCSANCQT